LKKLREVTNEVKESKVTEYLFITINARQNITFEELFEVMQKLTKKKWLTDYIYVFEQRSEIQYDYSGYHVHMILKRNGKKLFDIRKEFKSTLKHICDVSNPHILNIKNIKDNTDLKRRVNYITNFKADVNKHVKQYNDINFREHYKIERYYASNEHFSEYIEDNINPDQVDEIIDELHSDPSC
jgi:IS1 family transposase